MKAHRRFFGLVIGTALFWLTVGSVAIVWGNEASKDHVISVTGEADVMVIPNEVLVSAGVETWDKDLQLARKGNDDRMKQIMAFVTGHGVEPKYIKTDFIHIEPRYKREHEREIFIGWFVRKTVVITLKDVPKFDEILSGVLESGATHVHGIDFRTTDLRKYRDEARSLAVKAALEKASAMAAGLGQRLGKPLTVAETAPFSWSSYASYWGSRSRGMDQMTQNVRQFSGDEGPQSGGTISPGQIAIKAKVSITFQIE